VKRVEIGEKLDLKKYLIPLIALMLFSFLAIAPALADVNIWFQWSGHYVDASIHGSSGMFVPREANIFVDTHSPGSLSSGTMSMHMGNGPYTFDLYQVAALGSGTYTVGMDVNLVGPGPRDRDAGLWFYVDDADEAYVDQWMTTNIAHIYGDQFWDAHQYPCYDYMVVSAGSWAEWDAGPFHRDADIWTTAEGYYHDVWGSSGVQMDPAGQVAVGADIGAYPLGDGSIYLDGIFNNMPMILGGGWQDYFNMVEGAVGEATTSGWDYLPGWIDPP
jgi:hypothetical protein